MVLQCLDIVDHRQPPAIETAACHDEWIFTRHMREGREMSHGIAALHAIVCVENYRQRQQMQASLKTNDCMIHRTAQEKLCAPNIVQGRTNRLSIREDVNGTTRESRQASWPPDRGSRGFACVSSGGTGREQSRGCLSMRRMMSRPRLTRHRSSRGRVARPSSFRFMTACSISGPMDSADLDAVAGRPRCRRSTTGVSVKMA